uniref:PPM-type phosphatase domain-containing protein n=1 Tax=Strongyloides papillosus TaxID=174720 RepID=A0A0N5C7D3_STREA
MQVVGDQRDSQTPASQEKTTILRTWKITNTGLKEIKKVILKEGQTTEEINMGAFLDKPITKKSNDHGEGQGMRYGMASMQGWRVDMEDAHDVQIAMSNEPPFDKWSFFAVFDGHAGPNAAKHAAENLLKTIMETPEFEKLLQHLKDTGGTIDDETRKLIGKGLINGFLRHDEMLHNQPKPESSGTTAIAAIVTPEYVFLVNLGDSRAIFCKKDSEVIATEDHKPYNEKEKERIVKAGGNVMISRVNGALAVSRAFGDFEYKNVPNLSSTEQLVSPEPDVYEVQRDSNADEFFVLACDGIYDVLSNEELADLVRERLIAEDDLRVVTNQVLDYALSKGSRDNMTLILVTLKQAPTVNNEIAEKEKCWVEKLNVVIKDVITELKGECEDGEKVCLEVAVRKVNESDVIKDSPIKNVTYHTRYYVDKALNDFYDGNRYEGDDEGEDKNN